MKRARASPTWQIAEGEIDQARAYLQESEALGGGARTLGSLGEIFLEEGDLDRAQDSREQALAGFKASGHSYNHAATLEMLGEVARRRGDLASATTYFRQALEEVEALGDEAAIAEFLADLAAVAADEGDIVRAGRLAGAASAFRVPGRGDFPGDTSLDAFPQDAVEAGRMLTLEEAVEYAIAHPPTDPLSLAPSVVKLTFPGRRGERRRRVSFLSSAV